eukprot:jgi/Phyca11/20936/fgenesh1_pg.PHYCAscaffold_77_\
MLISPKGLLRLVSAIVGFMLFVVSCMGFNTIKLSVTAVDTQAEFGCLCFLGVCFGLILAFGESKWELFFFFFGFMRYRLGRSCIFAPVVQPPPIPASMSDLPEDFPAILRRLEAISAEECPESTPYAAQYRVIEILQKLRTTELAPAEIAVTAIKLGTTYLAVEEPHNAQPALEEAGNFFFPELVKFTTDITSDDGSEGQVGAIEAVREILKKMPQVQVKNEHEEFLTYVVELLNQLGVLWTNRSRLLRALCYLTAGQKLCDKHKKQDEALVAAQTHTHFYLAQVYGSLGMADESARFCLSTLELQLLQCVNAERGEDSTFTAAHEWTIQEMQPHV